MLDFYSLPKSPDKFMDWSWHEFEPFYQNLNERPLNEGNIAAWLADWTSLIDMVSEIQARLTVEVTRDTNDKEAERRYNDFLDRIFQKSHTANQRLKTRLISSGLEPQGFIIPLRKMKAEAGIFQEANLPLLSEERKLASRYNKITGSQTVTWDDKQLTLQQLRLVLHTPERATRERAWRLAAQRTLEDRADINNLWAEFMALRSRLARNAGCQDYRHYRWSQMTRLDYSPQDCIEFQNAVEEIAVPAATRVYLNCAERLGVTKLRPWDLDADLFPVPLSPPTAYGTTHELQIKVGNTFSKLDAEFGEYFSIMSHEGCLDLDNNVGKAPGAYCTSFPITRMPYIFMNAVGLSEDVRTLLHESGHAFHNFKRFDLPYAQQRIPGLEFAEVASMSTELLSSPFITTANGGFYSPPDADKFLKTHLERILTFWPYMAVVDAFQHWVYTHHEEASSPDNCDSKWHQLWKRYIPGVDWSGLKHSAETGWHRKPHIFRYPFYYIEYGLAQLGAVQVWRNAQEDPERSLNQFKGALCLGGTASLPDLYKTAGAKFAFDSQTLEDAVRFIENEIKKLAQ